MYLSRSLRLPFSGATAFFIDSVRLIVARETLELPYRITRVDTLFQNRAGKPRPCHLHELIDQDVASRTQIALEAKPAPQQVSLTVGPPIREMRKMQINAGDIRNPFSKRDRVRVIGKLKPVCVVFGSVIGRRQYLQVRVVRHSVTSIFQRASLAAALNGSGPTRFSVWIKVSRAPPEFRRSR